MAGSPAARTAWVGARLRAALAPDRAQQSPADRGGRDARLRDLRGPLRVRQRDDLVDAGLAGELQQGDVVSGSGGVPPIAPVHPDGLDVDPPPPFAEVVGAGQHLDVARVHLVHAMRGGEHPAGMDQGAAAELPEAGPLRLDQRHLPRPLSRIGLHAADDPRVLLRGGAAGGLVRRRRRPAGQQRPDRQGADDGGREGRCFGVLHCSFLHIRARSGQAVEQDGIPVHGRRHGQMNSGSGHNPFTGRCTAPGSRTTSRSPRPWLRPAAPPHGPRPPARPGA